jgi:hypothetical protein
LKNRSPMKLLKNLGNAFKGTQKMLMNMPEKRSYFSKARPTPYGVHLTPAEVRRASAKLESELKRVRQLSKGTQKNRRSRRV